jgi:hypothetical protein
VENLYWPLNTAPRGNYKVLDDHYANHGGTDPTEFRVAVKNDDEVKYYTGKVNPLEKVLVCEFERLTGPEPVPIGTTDPVPQVIINVTPPPEEEQPQKKRPPVYNRSDEEQAAQRLKLAQDLLALNKTDAAKDWLEDVVARYPNTKACEKAKKLLDELASGEGNKAAPKDGIYLADLTPVSENVGGDLQSRAATIGGVVGRHSLWTRTNLPNPPASAEYALGRRYSQLSGSVGIEDAGKADRTRVAASFQIVGDGKVLWSSRSLRNPGDKQDFDVNVSQVNRLKIVADSNNTPCHYAVWIDPWLAGRGKN